MEAGKSVFAPLAAIALCSAAYFPKKYKFSVPLVTLFISDVVINFRYGAPLLDPQILVRYAALALVGCVGVLLQNRTSLKTLLQKNSDAPDQRERRIDRESTHLHSSHSQI